MPKKKNEVEVSAPEDNVIWMIEKLQNKFFSGEIDYEKYMRYEMMELDFNPNEEESRKEYQLFLDSMADEAAAGREHTYFTFEPDEKLLTEVVCPSCNAIHKLWHMDWTLIVCTECKNIIDNPEIKE